ncbi:hypothetical protein MWU54_17390 [Marivita sp. S6314]|uniref:hypothetical protein n=1 Tax=Marivita sp. S6314 TaxID=2926406 RepID=UPI001FF60947|nr:hypothetical protein [Marivita sp. S6314]MCK0151821.1 hypothetical protein [Marivita sp. S6314]
MAQDKTRILTIGSSCINRFQFEFFQARHPDTKPCFTKSVFDWNITSLVATETVLRLAVARDLARVIQDRDLFTVEWNRLIFNSDLPGFCFYHEKDIAAQFHEPGQMDLLLSKLKHQTAPFLRPAFDGCTHLVWSNIQPNLPETVSGFMDWDTFVLTRNRYATIKSLAAELFGLQTQFTFFCNADDLDPDLSTADDVHVMDLPRGDTYRGDPDLYDARLLDILA